MAPSQSKPVPLVQSKPVPLVQEIVVFCSKFEWNKSNVDKLVGFLLENAPDDINRHDATKFLNDIFFANEDSEEEPDYTLCGDYSTLGDYFATLSLVFQSFEKSDGSKNTFVSYQSTIKFMNAMQAYLSPLLKEIQEDSFFKNGEALQLSQRMKMTLRLLHGEFPRLVEQDEIEYLRTAASLYEHALEHISCLSERYGLYTKDTPKNRFLTFVWRQFLTRYAKANVKIGTVYLKHKYVPKDIQDVIKRIVERTFDIEDFEFGKPLCEEIGVVGSEKYRSVADVLNYFFNENMYKDFDAVFFDDILEDTDLERYYVFCREEPYYSFFFSVEYLYDVEFDFDPLRSILVFTIATEPSVTATEPSIPATEPSVPATEEPVSKKRPADTTDDQQVSKKPCIDLSEGDESDVSSEGTEDNPICID